MPTNGNPTFDLPLVFFRKPSAHIVTAIPLKPTTGVVLFIDPSFLNPDFERLAGVFVKVIQRIVVMFGRKFGASKPILWKFFFAVGHILSAKDAEREHLFWREIRLEIRMKIPSHRFGKLVCVTILEFITHFNSLFSHGYLLSTYKIYGQ